MMTHIVWDEHTITLWRAAIEATSDGIMITDAESRIVLINRRFEVMWRLAPGWAESVTTHDRIQRFARLVSDPGHFLSRVDELYARPELETSDRLALRDGRIFERYSAGLRIGGHVAGRIWIFRDITSRERAESELRIMKSVVEALNQIVEPDRQLQEGLRALAIELGARAAWIWGIAGTHFARLLAHYGARELDIDLTPRMPDDQCECLHRLLEDDFPAAAFPITCSRLTHLSTQEEAGRHISIPIRSRDRPLAMLNLVLPVVQPFSVVELRMFAAIANQFSVAIERTRLFEAEREERSAAEALRHAAAALSATLDVDQVLDQVLIQVVRLIPCDAASILMVEGVRARVVRTHGYDRFGVQIGEAVRRVSFDIARTPTLRRLADTGQPWFINDTVGNPAWLSLDQTPAVRAWIGAPIIVHGQVVAFMSLDSVTPYMYRAEHMRRLATLADDASLALQNARLYARVSDALDRERRLGEVTRAISSQLDIDIILDNVVRLSTELVGADAGSLALLDADGRDLVQAHAYGLPDALMARKQGIEPAWRVVETRESVILHNIAIAGSEHGVAATDRNGALLGVPIVVGATLLGVLVVYHLHGRRRFSERDCAVLETVGRQAGVAITNAQLFAETRRLATTDYLTGLFNRRHFNAIAPREIERARRYQRPIALLTFDVDHFKAINDTYGHAAGDAVLIHIATRLRARLRDADLLARYGGEEFVALLPETNLAGAECVAERVRVEMEAQPVIVAGKPVMITMSIGVAAFDSPAETDQLEILLQYADRALYGAKSTGRNKVVLARR